MKRCRRDCIYSHSLISLPGRHCLVPRGKEIWAPKALVWCWHDLYIHIRIDKPLYMIQTCSSLIATIHIMIFIGNPEDWIRTYFIPLLSWCMVFDIVFQLISPPHVLPPWFATCRRFWRVKMYLWTPVQYDLRPSSFAWFAE